MKNCVSIGAVRRSSYGPAVVLRAVIAVVGATPVTAQQPARAAVIRQSTLDNGLQVLVVENHTVPLATVLVAVRTGAMTQGPGDRGLAHLYEHLLFRAYGSDPSFGVDATSLDAVYNGTTGEEVVTYFLMLPSKNAVKAIALLARLLQKARFSDYDLQQELPVVLNELQRDESDPDQALERQAEQRLWGPDWSRKDIGGDSATLKAMTVGRLQETYARYYVPNNAALLVTGDVAAEQMFAAAQERFGTWQRAPDPFVEHPIPPMEAMTASSATLVAQPVIHARIVVRLRGPSVAVDTAATYAADALCDVLNDPGSAFQHRFVGSGLFQSVTCRYQTLVHVGPISFEGETTPANATAALTVLLADLDQLGRLDGVTDEDLAIARQRRRVRAALAFEASSALAPSLARWWATAGVGYYEGYGERLDAQSVDDLRRFAQAYIVTRPRVVAVLAPSGVIERLRTQLRASAASKTP